MMTLTIFYDSLCPLCMAEMKLLESNNPNKRLKFIDLNDDNFNKQFPYINKSKAMKILHGELDNGELLLGLDVTCTAWALVGKHKWLMILRWPIIRILADATYLFFARYRSQISRLLTGKKPCTPCSLQNEK